MWAPRIRDPTPPVAPPDPGTNPHTIPSARQRSRTAGVPDDVDRATPAGTHSRTSVAFQARRSCRSFPLRVQTLPMPGPVLAVDRRGVIDREWFLPGGRACPGRPGAEPYRRICSPTSSNTASLRGWGDLTPTMRRYAINATSPAAPTRHTCNWEPIAATAVNTSFGERNIARPLADVRSPQATLAPSPSRSVAGSNRTQEATSSKSASLRPRVEDVRPHSGSDAATPY